MNENFEKIEFSKEEDNFNLNETSFSFYNFLKNPPILNLKNNINFFQNFNQNYNINMFFKNNSADINVATYNNENMNPNDAMELDNRTISEYRENTENRMIFTPAKTEKEVINNLVNSNVNNNLTNINLDYDNFNSFDDLNNDFEDFRYSNYAEPINTNKLADKFSLFASVKNKTHNSVIKSNQKISKEFFTQQINIINSYSTKKNIFENIIENPMNQDELMCPDYDTFSEERLKEEIKKYGLKPGSNKFMKKQLKEIWDFLNLSNILFIN